MKITNKLNLIVKIQLFICFALSMSFSFANTDYGSTSNTKLSPTDLNNFSEKTKQEKRKDNGKSKSNNNYHDIISTTSDCTASCCAGNNTVEKVGNSKGKSNNQKSKKKFRWFSRSK
tara:strand:- start:66 stop:416 length:351 start_codon:yes stop_codon:yes gene_type:complete